MSSSTDAELQARIESVEQQLMAVQSEMVKLNTESLMFMARFKVLEESHNRHQEELVALHASQEVNKALVKQILDRFDRFEERLLKMLSQAQTDGSKERTGTQKEYLKFAMYVIGTTLGAVIVYLFTKG